MAKKDRKASAPKTTHWPSAGWVVLAVFLLALLVRLAYLYESSDNPTFRTPIVDSQTYDGLARGLASGLPITRDFFWQPVFYPLFLGLLYWLSHFSILFVKIVQAVLGAATALLTFRLGGRIFGRATGLVAGIIVAFYLPLVFFELELLAAGWAAFWMVSMVLLLLKIREKPAPWRCFLFGLAGTLAYVTRPVFSLFFGAACIWLLIVWIREHSGAPVLIQRAAGLAVGFLLIAAPLAILSHQVTGRASILPYSGGINFYIGNNPNYKKTITIRPGLGWRELTALPVRQGIETDQGMERYFLDKTRHYILSEPGHFVKGLVTKTAEFFTSREIPRNTDIYLFRKWSLLLKLFVWKIGGFGFPFGVLWPLAFLGLVFYLRKVPGALLLALVFYPVSVILVFVAGRYRVPLVPVLSVLAAAGLETLWNTVKKKQWEKLALAGVIVLIAGIACSVPGPFYEEKLPYEAELYFGLGSTYDSYRQTEKAEAAYARAISLRADYAEAHFNLANILISQGEREEAIAHFRQSLQAEPGSVEIRNNLAAALRSQGRGEEAIAQWEKALEIYPHDAFAHFNIGIASAELGDYDRAAAHLKSALEVRPDWAEAHTQLGIVLSYQRDIDGAIAQFTEALRLRPDDADAHCNLGIALGSQDRLDEAVEQFRQAVKLDPDLAAAHYNLGFALELQDKLSEAIAEYRRVLQIDPDNAECRLRLAEAEEALNRKQKK